MAKDQKSMASCGFYFILLLIYLHMVGCLYFFFCLQTYEKSTAKLDMLDQLQLRDFRPYYEEEYRSAKEAIALKGEGATVHAWMSPVDNYDGKEKFWRSYELSRLTMEEKDELSAKNGGLSEKDYQNGHFAFIWSYCIYYTLEVIGGNEMQPAQEIEQFFVVIMNIVGLIFITWIIGEIAVIVA